MPIVLEIKGWSKIYIDFFDVFENLRIAVTSSDSTILFDHVYNLLYNNLDLIL